MTSETNSFRQIPWARVDDHSIIVEPASGALILLNPTATLIWQAMRCGKTVPEIIRSLKQTFRISNDQAASDVEYVIKNCRLDSQSGATHARGKPDRWQKPKPVKTASRPDAEPVQQQCYQLNSQLFKVVYYHKEAFSLLQKVLGHLQVSEEYTAGRSQELTCYEIFYRGNYLLFESGKLTHEFENLDQLVEGIQWTLVENAYQDGDWLAVVHAGAVGDQNGRATVFIAQRGSGKSTLVRWLQSQGFIYLADDVVPVTFSGHMLPMPMCQRFKQGSWELLDIASSVNQRIYARYEGHHVKYAQPLTGSTEQWKPNWSVQTIIFPSYNPEINAPALKRLTQVQTLTRLCGSGSVFGGSMNRRQLEALVAWIASVPAYSLDYAEFGPALTQQLLELSL